MCTIVDTNNPSFLFLELGLNRAVPFDNRDIARHWQEGFYQKRNIINKGGFSENFESSQYILRIKKNDLKEYR